MCVADIVAGRTGMVALTTVNVVWKAVLVEKRQVDEELDVFFTQKRRKKKARLNRE